MYSCNWVDMNLKFKKLLQLVMSINNADKFIINITPKKIVNLQLFANVNIQYL